MKRSFHLILGLMVATLGFASFAAAQDGVAIKGHVMSGFGQKSTSYADGEVWVNQEEKGSVSELTTEGQAQVEFRAKRGPLAARYRLRIRENSGDLAAARFNVSWDVAPTFNIRFDGRGFGTNYEHVGYGGYGSVAHFGYGTAFDPEGDIVSFANINAVDFTFKGGIFEAGLMLISGCQPDCVGGDSEQQTTVPHALLNLGSIKASLYMASSSGTDTEETIVDGAADITEKEADMMTLSVYYGAGNIKAGLTYASGSQGSADEGPDGNNDLAGMMLGGKLTLGNGGVVGLSYGTPNTETENDATGTATGAENSNTFMALGYTHPLADKAEMAVGYASNTETRTPTTAAGGEEVDETVTQLLVSVLVGF